MFGKDAERERDEENGKTFFAKTVPFFFTPFFPSPPRPSLCAPLSSTILRHLTPSTFPCLLREFCIIPQEQKQLCFAFYFWLKFYQCFLRAGWDRPSAIPSSPPLPAPRCSSHLFNFLNIPKWQKWKTKNKKKKKKNPLSKTEQKKKEYEIKKKCVYYKFVTISCYRKAKCLPLFL